MVAVAVIALLIGGIALARRSAHYRREALFHSRAAARSRAEQRSKASTAKAGREQAEMWRRRARNTGSKTAEKAAEETAPGIKGATASAQVKPATLETGLVVTVPSFINTGDKLKIDSRDGSYLGRVNG